MAAPRFYENCREQGMQLTMKQAEEMREDWIKAFREMKDHMKPEPVHDTKYVGRFFGRRDDDEEEDEDDGTHGKQLFRAQLINGMIRNRCTYCAALNVQFQGLAAYGMKMAMWNLAMHGYLPRIINMIHDEVVYYLYPDELAKCIPDIEKCMIDGMRVATPHVKVGVETSLMLHWDKGAVEYVKAKKDDNGLPILEEPPFVQEVLGTGNGKKEQ